MKPFLMMLLVARLASAVVQAADVSGAWVLEFDLTSSQRTYRGECTFKHEGERITGSCLSGYESLVAVNGAVKQRAVTFQFATGTDQGTTVTFSGELDETDMRISGSVRFLDRDGNSGDGRFTATRP